MSKELKLLIDRLGITEDRAIMLLSGGSTLKSEFELNPEDFLERAEDDYELGGSAALLNSITNAKRAIHCQMDQALVSLGYTPNRWKLPKKVEVLAQLGFVTPRILKRVTDARNMLEHEYSSPTLEQVEEALDLASLFIGATNRLLEGFWGEFNLGNYDEQVDTFHCKNELQINFGYFEKGFNVRGCTNVSPEREPETRVILEEIFIKPSDQIYTDIVRLVASADRESKLEKALKQFFVTLSKF
jgi:hypothetical protein